MPEPTAPDQEDSTKSSNPQDITNSPYARDRSAREEEVGGAPDPESTRRIREILDRPVAADTTDKEEVAIPATEEQARQRAAEARERLRITRIPAAERTSEEQAYLDSLDDNI